MFRSPVEIILEIVETYWYSYEKSLNTPDYIASYSDFAVTAERLRSQVEMFCVP